MGIQVSGTWTSVPGAELAANYVATNAAIAAGPQPLGRLLSAGQCHGQPDSSRDVCTPTAGPTSTSASRRSSGSAGRGPRLGSTSTTLTNTDVVTGFNQTFSPTSTTWLTPTSIQPARYVKINAQFDF